jgi:hypothetical protein
MITRSFDHGEKADGQSKNNVIRKEPVTVKQFALQSNGVGDGAIYSRVPSCCEQNGRQTESLQITVI